MRTLEWDNMGMKIDGRQLHYLRFADGDDLITRKISQAERMLANFDKACFSVACISCDSTLAYELECFWRQTSLFDFRTLNFQSANVKMLNEPMVFLIDVIDNGIYPTANELNESQLAAHPVRSILIRMFQCEILLGPVLALKFPMMTMKNIWSSL
ncbi:unnamed protein product [Angiostrongylus costaricensis]|uniref:DUF2326 domain-containing protein n=1 Tax=Angiostrongylus costaricensis TaxID=334426 RepID=A0A0R3Q0B4_ANGCS|nr:unnamed protein product [Angiostrongylus costaricensis]